MKKKFFHKFIKEIYIMDHRSFLGQEELGRTNIPLLNFPNFQSSRDHRKDLKSY